MGTPESSAPPARLARFVAGIERRGGSPWTPILAAIFVAALRMTEEHVWVQLPRGLRRDPVVWFGHVSAFYACLALCIAAVLYRLVRRPAAHVISAASAGLIVGVLPPVLDTLVYGAGAFNYEYHLDPRRPFSFLLYDPPHVTPLGETIAVWTSFALMALYAWVKGAGLARTLGVLLAHYGLVLFFLAGLPAASFRMTAQLSGIGFNEVATLGLTLVALLAYLSLRPGLLPLLGRRLPHALLPPALVAVGAAWSATLSAHTALAAAALFVSGVVFTLSNDYYDRAEDVAQGRAALVTHGDVIVLSVLQAPLWLALSAGHFWVTLSGLAFAVIAWSYHGDPLRLKCIFPLSYKTEGLLAFVCLLAGALAPPRHDLPIANFGVFALAAAGVSVAALFKDRKDVAGDSAAGVQTLYTVLQGRGWPLGRIDALVATALATCLAVPVLYLLAARGTPLAAAALGVLAFAAVAVLRSRLRPATGVAVTLLLLSSYLATLAWALAASAPPPL